VWTTLLLQVEVVVEVLEVVVALVGSALAQFCRLLQVLHTQLLLVLEVLVV
jgi:hypothetical protein